MSSHITYEEQGKEGLNMADHSARRSVITESTPVWKRFTLTITEAAEYYHIGESKLRDLVERYPDSDFAILNGNRVLIKRPLFEKFLEKATTL
jgi:excisionase family DNA binding protein